MRRLIAYLRAAFGFESAWEPEPFEPRAGEHLHCLRRHCPGIRLDGILKHAVCDIGADNIRREVTPSDLPRVVAITEDTLTVERGSRP